MSHVIDNSVVCRYFPNSQKRAFILLILLILLSSILSARPVSPVEFEPLLMPTDQGVRLEQRECLETAWPEAVEPDPKEPTESNPLAILVGDPR